MHGQIFTTLCFQDKKGKSLTQRHREYREIKGLIKTMHDFWENQKMLQAYSL
jgi:hypothetical protein